MKYIGHVRKKINITTIFTAAIYADFYGFQTTREMLEGFNNTAIRCLKPRVFIIVVV